MEIKGIIWVGSSSDDHEASTKFFSEVIGMSLITNVDGFSRLAATNGDRLELFGPSSREHDLLDTGPVAGLWVDDCAAARAELLAAGVAEVTDVNVGPDGHRWLYFRAPDGKYFELCEDPHPRQPKGPAGR